MKYFVYKTEADKTYHYGNSGKINQTVVNDASEYFTSAEEVEAYLSTFIPTLKPTETLKNIEIRQFKREKNGTYHYEYKFNTYETLKNAVDSQDYYYIEVTVHIEQIEGTYALTDPIPESICKRAKGAMTRFCNKANASKYASRRYTVIELPESQIIKEEKQ